MLRNMLRLAIALCLAAAAAPLRAQDDEEMRAKLPVEEWPQEEGVESLGPGLDILHPVAQRPLSRAPLRISSNNLQHSLFGLLPLESADTLEDGSLQLAVYEDYSTGKLEITEPDYFFRYEGTLTETTGELRLGLYDDWELRVGVDVSNLLEEEDDIILVRQGAMLIESGTRGTSIGDLRIAAKKRLLTVLEDSSLGVIVGAKFPVSRSRQDLLTSGNVDIAVSLLYTQDIGDFTFHLNAGGIIPGDCEVYVVEVETRNALTFGAGASFKFADWGLLAVQVQGNQSVFEDSDDSIRVFEDTVGSFHVGTRVRVGSYFIEGSFGAGINDRSSDTIITAAFILPLS